jgi:hypothetical protein
MVSRDQFLLEEPFATLSRARVYWYIVSVRKFVHCRSRYTVYTVQVHIVPVRTFDEMSVLCGQVSLARSHYESCRDVPIANWTHTGEKLVTVFTRRLQLPGTAYASSLATGSLRKMP